MNFCCMFEGKKVTTKRHLWKKTIFAFFKIVFLCICKCLEETEKMRSWFHRNLLVGFLKGLKGHVVSFFLHKQKYEAHFLYLF